jgi:hypothetical protein
MIPWDNVTISARSRITQANKRLRSLTAGGGRHGMAISRGLVVQNGRCSRRSPSVVLRLGMRPQCTQSQAAYATAKFSFVAHATLHVVGEFSFTAIVSCGTRPAWAIGVRGGSVSPTCSGFSISEPPNFSLVSRDSVNAFRSLAQPPLHVGPRDFAPEGRSSLSLR